MKNLKGSEKQIAWAEEIRKKYINLVPKLEEMASIYDDISQKEIVDHDPLFGDSTLTVYVNNVSESQVVALELASSFKPERKIGKECQWHLDRAKQIGGPHAERLARRDFVIEIIASIKSALVEEDSAKFWIENR